MSDPAKYRQKSEVDAWRKTDPLERTLYALKEFHGVSEEELDAIDQEIINEMNEALEFAEQSPEPEAGARFRNILAEDNEHA